MSAFENCVVVEHQEAGDWALVIVATRNSYGRRYVVPMIFTNEGCGIWAVCPQLRTWVRAGLISLYNPPPEKREELLKNAIQEFVRAVVVRANILERSRVGIVARAKARPEIFDTPPEGFALDRDREPAFFWLAERSETASQAMRVVRYLIEKHKLGAPTRNETEAAAMKLLTRGEQGHGIKIS